MKRARAESFDVLGLGVAAVDDVLYVPSYPVAEAKVRVARSTRRCGGLTAAALVAAARVGARCAYAACLGMDEFSQHIATSLTHEGISLKHAPRLPQAGVVHSIIIVGQDTGSRTILFEAGGLIGAHDTLPSAEVIRAAKVLFIDHYGMRGNLRAARIARAAGVPIVADFENANVQLFQEVLELVDHLILSQGFALRLTRASTPADAALALWQPDRAAVVVTAGPAGSWSVSTQHNAAPQHHPAFPVEPADTTGCGDVFHGAYAARLARGDDLEQRIRFASAAAALKAREAETPRLAAVQRFLREHQVGRGKKKTPDER
jgi:sugar/nucleoside kinase (ribokinase family)